MHLYFYLRGIQNMQEMWKIFAQSQFWKWKRKNLKTRKNEIIPVQGSLRSSVLGTWEYVFPEECLAEVLSCFGIYAEVGTDPSFKNKVKLATLRKMIGCEKIPAEEYEKAKKIPPSIIPNNFWRCIVGVSVPGIAIHPIGIKKDIRQKVPIRNIPTFGYEQEML